MMGESVKIRRVREVLCDIPGFTGARIDAQLSDGPTNASYLLEQSGEHYVLRLDKPDAVKLGLDRSNEKRVCKIVAKAGLAPEPGYFDAVSGVYLRRFLPGRSWGVSDLASLENLVRLARLLRKLHSLPPPGTAFEPLAAARRYAVQLGGGEPRSILCKAEMLMQKIEAGSAEMVLCHNDLVCQNVLEGSSLMLIDWEYSAIGDPFFDLAVVVRHHRLDKKSAHYFLDAYLGRSSSALENGRLKLHSDFYQCLLDLWELRVRPPGGC